MIKIMAVFLVATFAAMEWVCAAVDVTATQSSITGTVFCACGGDITFTANAHCPPGANLTYTWSDDTTGTGASITKTFSTAGTGKKATVTVSGDTTGTATVTFDIVGDGTVPTSVEVNYKPLIAATSNPGWGNTQPGLPDIDITAYCDKSGKWKCKITKADEQIKQSVRLVTGVTEVTGDIVASTTDCAVLTTMKTSLNSVASQGPHTGYYMLAGVKAHEDVHVSDDHAAIDGKFPALKTALEALEVPFASYSTPTAAKAAIKALPAYTTAKDTFEQAVTAAFNVSGSHNPITPFNTAEHSVVDPMIVTIDQRKNALGCK